MGRLAQELEEIWRKLALACEDATRDFRKLALATTDVKGRPQVRMVILRGFEQETRRLLAYTDPRTPKWGELRENSTAQVMFWSEESKVQLRCDCEVRLLEEGETWERARRAVPEHMAGDYAALRRPGEAIAAPEDGWEQGEEWHFGVIELQIEKMDFLKLSREGHRRASFSWEKGREEFTWRQP